MQRGYRAFIAVSILCMGAASGFVPQQPPLPFYYYHNDTVRLTETPHVLSGALHDPADSLWLESWASAEGVRVVERRSGARMPEFFLLRLDSLVPRTRLDVLLPRWPDSSTADSRTLRRSLSLLGSCSVRYGRSPSRRVGQ
jgi:hypothetical protein